MSNVPRSDRRPHGWIYSSILTERARALFALSLAALIFFAPLGFTALARTAEKPQASPKTTANSNAGFNMVHNHKGGDSAHQKPQIGEADGFIIQMVNGMATCREATLEELPGIMAPQDTPTIPARDLYQPTKGGDNYVKTLEEANLTINFAVRTQLANNPDTALRNQVLAAFQKAAAVWTSKIKSPVSITIEIDYGPNNTSNQPFQGGVIASAGSFTTSLDYPGLRNNLILSASSQGEANIYNALPASAVPTDVGNGTFVSLNTPVAKALGLTFAPNNTDAVIGFNSNVQFDFNPDDGIDVGKTDFVGVAVHEMGHTLGFSSNGGTNNPIPKIWDLFRFRTGTTGGNFATAQRILSIGGQADNSGQFYFTGQSFTLGGASIGELPLSTGGPSGSSTNNGDGRQSSHWKDDNLNGGKYVGIMDPTIPPGVTRQTTDNDFMALETIGWNLTTDAPLPPPPPPPAPPTNNNLANAQVISGCTGSLAATNAGATKEAGEPSHSDDDNGGGASVWYQWTAPSSTSVTITTEGSNYDTLLGVYTGNAINGLTLVGRDDDVQTGVITSSAVTFTATAGTNYKIAVDGYDGAVGPLKLNWSQENCTATVTPTVTLSGNTYSVSEAVGVGVALITVNRAGDAAASATVDYSTSDASGTTPCQINVNGQASDRCDYATAVGTLRFAAGETSKQIQIPLINDFHAEPDEIFTITLKNPQGISLGAITTATVTITSEDAAGATTNPVSGLDFFLFMQYVDFLGRVPDAGGFSFWKARMTTNCPAGDTCDRTDTAKRFFESDEFKERGYHVFKLYDVILGRLPLYTEFVPDVARLNGFQTVAEQQQNKAAYLADFMAKQEFRNLYSAQVNTNGTLIAGQATAFVDALIARAGITIAAGTRTSLINNLQSGARTPAQTIEDFILTPEIGNVGTKFYDRAIITMQYFGFLRRNPDSGGFNFWWDRLANPASPVYHNYREIVGNFITSDEYYFRFSNTLFNQ